MRFQDYMRVIFPLQRISADVVVLNVYNQICSILQRSLWNGGFPASARPLRKGWIGNGAWT